MKMPTSDEIWERYRSLSDDELLVLAAESTSLTPEADEALKQEVARRGLRQTDVEEASARLIRFKAKDTEVQRALFDFRSKLAYTLRSLILVALLVVSWWVSAFVARAFFKSPETRVKFQEVAFVLAALALTTWEVVRYVKKRRNRRRATASKQ
jgi:hypothetical protein